MSELNKKQIPVYEMFLDGSDQDGVFGIAVTKAPAIERDFVALSKDAEQSIKFSTDKKQQVVTGAIFIPDQLIYRKDQEGNPYYLRISADEIKKVAQKFFKDSNHRIFNIEHQKSVDDVFVFESWICGKQDKIREMDARFTEEFIPAGSWIVSAKIENSILWEQIEMGEFTGFSMEGMFSTFEVDLNKQISDINNLIDQLEMDQNPLDKLRAIENFFQS